MTRAAISDEELEQWAKLRADDAGHLARELVIHRRAALKLAVMAEREACAHAADYMAHWVKQQMQLGEKTARIETAEQIAKAIRARSEP